MTEEPTNEVSIAPAELGAIGAELESGALRFTEAAARMLTGFDTDPQHRPYAADPRNEPAQPVVRRHEDAVAAARDLLEALGSGMTVLGRAAAGIGSELAERDAVSAADTRNASDSAAEH